MEKNKSNILIIAVVVALLAAAGVAYILRDNAKARKAVETRTEEALQEEEIKATVENSLVVAAGNVRSSISNSSSIGQHLAVAAFREPSYIRQKRAKYAVLKNRYRVIRGILKTHPEYAETFEPMPFNSGYFMCVKPKGVEAEAVRRHLIEKYSTGTIVLSGLIRLAFSTIPAKTLPKLFANVDAAVRELQVRHNKA